MADKKASKRHEFHVELYVDATDEKAVWALLGQLKSVEGAGLLEEPVVRIAYDDEDEDE